MSEWTLHNMDCLEGLRMLPDESVQCCVTSPPYYQLRDYGVAGQIGLEESPEEYVAKLVEVFREVRRVLRPDGTLWLNIGDSYAGSGKGRNADGSYSMGSNSMGSKQETNKGTIVGSLKKTMVGDGIKPKDLIGIPWMVAFALRADGWWLRSDIVWAKPNPMPESVTDRPTRSHEFIFLLTKSERYYYDHEAIAEPAVSTRGSGNDFVRPQQISKGLGSTQPWEPSNRHNFRRDNSKRAEIPGQRMGSHRPDREDNGPYTMRNKRSVWTVATQPFSEAHFAVFPPKLIEPCILAGSSPQACPKCGAPWSRVMEVTKSWREEAITTQQSYRAGSGNPRARAHSGGMSRNTRQEVGWQPTCSCEGNDGSGKSVVLDPFAGAGTTLLVASQWGRNSIGFELNPDYCEIIRKRLSNVQLRMQLA